MNKNYFEIFILINDIEKSLTINIKRTWRTTAIKIAHIYKSGNEFQLFITYDLKDKNN